MPQLLTFQTESTPDRVLVATAPELAEVLNDVNNLAFQDESDEFGLLRPSLHAFRECMKSILSLARELQLLRPSEIATDRNLFPTEENSRPYLYYSSPTSYDTELDLNPRSIGKLIRWAVDGR